MLKVLYIDDEPINLNIFEMAFKRDFQIFCTESANNGLEIIQQEEIDVIITDLKMPGMDGIELIKEVKNQYPKKNCILLTAYYEPDLANDPDVKPLIYKYIVKPFKKNELRQVIIDASV